MKISKKSWHYRVWAYKRTTYERRTPPNLCRYFWMIIAKIFIGIPFMVISPIFGFSLGSDYDFDLKRPWLLLSWVFGVWLFCVYSYLFIDTSELSKIACQATWAFGVAISVICIFEYIKGVGSKQGTFTSVMLETLAAKKSKICPIIEVVDLEESHE